MPKTKTVSHATTTRQSPRIKRARVEAEEEAAKAEKKAAKKEKVAKKEEKADKAAAKAEQEVLDLTESSDEEIQEIPKAVVKEKTSKEKGKTANMATYMSSLAADMEAQQAAKRRQEYIANFLAKPSARQLQLNYERNFLTRPAMQSQAYMNRLQMMQYPTFPNTNPQTIDLTQETSPTRISTASVQRPKPDTSNSKLASFSVSDRNAQGGRSDTGSSVKWTNSGTTSNVKGNSSGIGSSSSVQGAPRPGSVSREGENSNSNSKKSSGNIAGNGDKMIIEFETGYKCTRCLKFLESRADLKHHIIKVHTDLLNFKCGKCGEVFSNQEKLVKHEKNHGRDKAYVCIHCQKCFYHQDNLKRHEKIHEKKKEFKCSGCPRVYTEMSKLVMHERIHKKSELPYQCEECDEGFHARGNLKMHIRTVHTVKGKKKR